MSLVSRANRNVLADWWLSVDRWQLVLSAVLISFGLLMTLAASPEVARNHGLPLYHFAYKQFVFLILGTIVAIGISCLSSTNIRRFAFVLFAVSLVGLVGTLFWGSEIKGAQRWIYLAGISIQPSEFVKPSFTVLCAWLFARQNTQFESSAALYTFAMLLLLAGLLLLQPDVGQMTLLVFVWACIYFLAGASLRFLAVLSIVGLVLGVLVYNEVDHVKSRIDRFVDPSSGDTFQVDRAMDAIAAGGITGVGPGNGKVKSILPDAHTDYVFAVAVEEGGFILAAAILLTFAGLLWRCTMAIYREGRHWVQLAVSGLACLFGLQVCINLAVNLNLMPSKGMTLPFVSYGGSSLLATSVTLGMIIGLSRRRGSLDREAPIRRSQIRIVASREVVS